MDEKQFDNQLLPKENWFKRNWKWAVPVGCLSMVGLFIVLLVGGAFWGISKVVNDNDVTSHAMSIINHNSEVKEQLGTNIETDGISTSQMSYDSRIANLDTYATQLASHSEYAPNETEIQIVSLQTYHRRVPASY